jgi:hypothetical protein
VDTPGVSVRYGATNTRDEQTCDVERKRITISDRVRATYRNEARIERHWPIELSIPRLVARCD